MKFIDLGNLDIYSAENTTRGERQALGAAYHVQRLVASRAIKKDESQLWAERVEGPALVRCLERGEDAMDAYCAALRRVSWEDKAERNAIECWSVGMVGESDFQPLDECPEALHSCAVKCIYAAASKRLTERRRNGDDSTTFGQLVDELAVLWAGFIGRRIVA
jgi:hypothetical protein